MQNVVSTDDYLYVLEFDDIHELHTGLDTLGESLGNILIQKAYNNKAENKLKEMVKNNRIKQILYRKKDYDDKIFFTKHENIFSENRVGVCKFNYSGKFTEDELNSIYDCDWENFYSKFVSRKKKTKTMNLKKLSKDEEKELNLNVLNAFYQYFV